VREDSTIYIMNSCREVITLQYVPGIVEWGTDDINSNRASQFPIVWYPDILGVEPSDVRSIDDSQYKLKIETYIY